MKSYMLRWYTDDPRTRLSRSVTASTRQRKTHTLGADQRVASVRGTDFSHPCSQSLTKRSLRFIAAAVESYASFFAHASTSAF